MHRDLTMEMEGYKILVARYGTKTSLIPSLLGRLERKDIPHYFDTEGGGGGGDDGSLDLSHIRGGGLDIRGGSDPGGTSTYPHCKQTPVDI